MKLVVVHLELQYLLEKKTQTHTLEFNGNANKLNILL